MSPARRDTRRPARPPSAVTLWRAGWVIVMTLGVAGGFWWTSRHPQAGEAPRASRPGQVIARATPRGGTSPGFGTTRAVEVPPRSVPLRASAPEPTPAGRVAIIFDDAGANLEQLEPILALGRPVTIAILPGCRPHGLSPSARPPPAWRSCCTCRWRRRRPTADSAPAG